MCVFWFRLPLKNGPSQDLFPWRKRGRTGQDVKFQTGGISFNSVSHFNRFPLHSTVFFSVRLSESFPDFRPGPTHFRRHRIRLRGQRPARKLKKIS